MKRINRIFWTVGTLIYYLACGPLSLSDSSLSGTWDCTLLGVSVLSSAEMKLKEDDGKLTGNIKWNDLNLPISGTVNSKRQVNIEAQESPDRVLITLAAMKDDTFLDGSFSYYQNFTFVDGGSFDAEKR